MLTGAGSSHSQKWPSWGAHWQQMCVCIYLKKICALKFRFCFCLMCLWSAHKKWLLLYVYITCYAAFCGNFVLYRKHQLQHLILKDTKLKTFIWTACMYFGGKKTQKELICVLVLLTSSWELGCSDATYNGCYAFFLMHRESCMVSKRKRRGQRKIQRRNAPSVYLYWRKGRMSGKHNTVDFQIVVCFTWFLLFSKQL